MTTPCAKAPADVATCKYWEGAEFESYPGMQRAYRVAGSTFDGSPDLMPNVSSQTGTLAIIQAADTWNEETNHGYFRYLGSAASADLPEHYDYSKCGSSLVKVREQGPAYAQTFPKCKIGDVPYQFQIDIYAKGSNGNWPWKVGAIGPGDLDLVGIMTHELGHTLDLGHPMNDCNPLPCTPMRWSVLADVQHDDRLGTTWYRDPYQYDLECLWNPAKGLAMRDLTAYYRFQSNGVLSSEYPLSGTWNMADVGALVTKQTGSWSFGYTGYRTWDGANEECSLWARGTGTANARCVDSLNRAGAIGPTAFVRREEDGAGTVYDRVLAASPFELPWPYQTAKHYARWVRSSDGFATETLGSLYHCTSMSSWMTCSGTARVYTGRALAVAWDNNNDQTVYAWVNQNRLNDSEEREIRLSVGSVSDGTLPQPDKLGPLGVYSKASPGVACNAYSAGPGSDYDCILAYVNDRSGQSFVTVRYFYSTSNGHRYVANFAPDVRSIVVPTTSRIAAWYHDSRFWIAIRTALAGQTVWVYSSPDGMSWTLERNDLDSSAVGPSAVSYWNSGSNILTYAR